MEFVYNLAEGCMPLLHSIQELRTPLMDSFFSAITHLGEETFFLGIAILFFWCLNKREGYFILVTGLIGAVTNQFAKILFRIPRPWVLDPEFDIVESARAEATGYSFPSGHTQNISSTYGSIAAYKPKWWKTILCVTIIGLVSFSRMYLGVHTPLDVGASLLVSLVLVLILAPCFKTEERMRRTMPWIIIVSILFSFGFLAYVTSISGTEGIDAHNYESALENAYALLGCTIALVPVYILDTAFVKFETDARWYAQILKLGIGLGIVLAIKVLLKTPINDLCGDIYIGRAIRYFLMVMFAGGIWPMTFKWFKKL